MVPFLGIKRDFQISDPATKVKLRPLVNFGLRQSRET
jgi:hypothetical protein